MRSSKCRAIPSKPLHHMGKYCNETVFCQATSDRCSHTASHCDENCSLGILTFHGRSGALFDPGYRAEHPEAPRCFGIIAAPGSLAQSVRAADS